MLPHPFAVKLSDQLIDTLDLRRLYRRTRPRLPDCYIFIPVDGSKGSPEVRGAVLYSKILGISFAAASVLTFAAGAARAEFIANIQQVGPNVVATGSGTFDLAGLSFLQSGT
jgi:hypothetical protein